VLIKPGAHCKRNDTGGVYLADSCSRRWLKFPLLAQLRADLSIRVVKTADSGDETFKENLKDEGMVDIDIFSGWVLASEESA
jgi:hypothetical protein